MNLPVLGSLSGACAQSHGDRVQGWVPKTGDAEGDKSSEAPPTSPRSALHTREAAKWGKSNQASRRTSPVARRRRYLSDPGRQDACWPASLAESWDLRRPALFNSVLHCLTFPHPQRVRKRRQHCLPGPGRPHPSRFAHSAAADSRAGPLP